MKYSNISNLRDQQSIVHNDDIYNTLRMVDINPIELCNRKCSFCPRSDSSIYSNMNNRITIETCKNLAGGLHDMNYTGRIGFAGFGEPLLHKELEECVSAIAKNLPDVKWMEINTNGDYLTRDKIESLAESGVNTISVSMYDEDVSEQITDICKGIDISIIYRHHYNKTDDYNLNVVDRKNIITKQIKYNYDKPCYIPFYKTFIDWNGDVLICDNDWSRSVTFGNVNTESFKDIWLGEKLMEYRKQLLTTRTGLLPCNTCDVCGTIRGSDSVDIFKSHIL